MSNYYERLCKRASESISQKQRSEVLYPLMKYAGIKDDYDFWIGKKIVLISLLVCIGVIGPWSLGKYFGLLSFESIEILIFDYIFLLAFEPSLVSIILGLSFGIIGFISVYLHLNYVIDARTKIVEESLPDFLFLVSSNINAGMTAFSGFRSAARKEFGPLSEEIKNVTSRSLGTQSFQQSLKSLTKNIRSSVLEETVSFFGQALKSGGRLAKLLESSAEDLRQTQEMKKELISSTKMYTMFIIFAVVIGAPLLLSVSVKFLGMIESIQSQNVVGGGDFESVAFLAGSTTISPDIMRQIAYFLLIANSFLSGMFISVITSGKARQGLRYMPLILISSLIVFYLSEFLIGLVLGV